MIRISNEDFNIKKIADSGQTFRLNPSPEGWTLIAENRLLKINEDGPDALLDCSEEEYKGKWRNYFDMNTDYAAFRAAIPGEDNFLKPASEFGKGIRILRQDPWEMLITFIISQRKNIPAIKSSVESICRRFGTAIDEDNYAFPCPDQLARASEDELRSCSLGYRVPYIMQTAKDVDDGKADLAALSKLSDQELTEELLKFKGVGIKVANCVSLFAYHRIDAFPIDVWIARVLKEEYHNNFPFELYKGFGGVIQQYMFYYARSRK